MKPYLAAVLILAACGGKAKPSAAPSSPAPTAAPAPTANVSSAVGDCAATDEACVLAALQTWAKQVCACGSKTACVEGVIGQMKVWGKAMAERRGPNHVFTPAYDQRVAEIRQEMDACFEK
jgi:hypothetical protein